ncbi:MAG: glycosyltransferase [Planctomycetota bacterium]
MHSSVIVPTYEQPRELGMALAGLSRQRVLPGEVVIADDGSGPETRALVERWRPHFRCPLVHVWQPDEGYRKARCVNRAVRRSGGEHLIFIDGDTFPDRNWVADHLAERHRGGLLCGRRVKLGPLISDLVGEEEILAGAFDRPLVRLLRTRLRRDVKRLNLGVRLPAALARAVHRRRKRILGVNFSLPRVDFERVNGLHEAWECYGNEDYDLQYRLERAGVESIPLLNRAVVFHLWHEERVRDAASQALLKRCQASGEIRCKPGLDAPHHDRDEREVEPIRPSARLAASSALR